MSCEEWEWILSKRLKGTNSSIISCGFFFSYVFFCFVFIVPETRHLVMLLKIMIEIPLLLLPDANHTLTFIEYIADQAPCPIFSYIISLKFSNLKKWVLLLLF